MIQIIALSAMTVLLFMIVMFIIAQIKKNNKKITPEFVPFIGRKG